MSAMTGLNTNVLIDAFIPFSPVKLYTGTKIAKWTWRNITTEFLFASVNLGLQQNASESFRSRKCRLFEPLTPDRCSFRSAAESRMCSSLSICSFRRSSSSCIIIRPSSVLLTCLPTILLQTDTHKRTESTLNRFTFKQLSALHPLSYINKLFFNLYKSFNS